MDKVKLVVTQEKFDRNFSIDDWFNFDKLSQKEVYEKMLLFVTDEEGNELSVEDARRCSRPSRKGSGSRS